MKAVKRGQVLDQNRCSMQNQMVMSETRKADDQAQSGTNGSSDPHGPPDNIRGHWRVQIGADNDINSQHEFSLTNATANGLDLEDDNVLSVDDARTAITAIDHAIDEVNQERSYIGSEQNKLQFTMSNLTSQTQSIEAARSSIQDTDFAADAADLAKNQILANQLQLCQLKPQPYRRTYFR